MLTERKLLLNRRSREIVAVLLRHGLGFLLAGLDIAHLAPGQHLRARPSRRWPAHTRPQHVRLAIEELGPTFVKFGQMLSTRADLIPPAYQQELARLQDTVPAEPANVIMAVLSAELGNRCDELFAAIDPEPLAAASIGQVHAATLADGTEVIIKIQRPGVQERIATDLEMLQDLAEVASRHWEYAEQFDLIGLVQEFARTLRAELDYLHEAANAERFAAQFARDPYVHIPRVIHEATTARVLTLERLHGVKVTDTPALAALAIDRARLARQSAQIILTMIFVHGVYHADPHPGNFFIEDDGRIGIVDFGMVGSVDVQLREHLALMLLAITARDSDALVDAILDLGVISRPINRALFRRDLEHLLAPYYDQPLGDIALGPIIHQMLTIVQRHHLQLPPTIALLMKTLMMYEQLGVCLDPAFHLTSFLAPYAQELVIRQLSPARWARHLGSAGISLARLGLDLPRQIRHIVGDLERGTLQFSLQPTSFTEVVRRLEGIVNRLILGILVAALIIGLALLLVGYRPPAWDRLEGFLFFFGILAVIVLSFILAISIIRSGRKML
jgi:ubiquinone biosynthesis protein